MHLLAAKPGGFNDEEGIIDLQQTPADIVILSAQDTSLGLLADVAESLPESFPSLRLANLINLNKPTAYDLYEHAVLQYAKLIVVSLLGGKNYWPYGVEQLIALAKKQKLQLILIPGDDEADEELFSSSTVEQKTCIRIWRYLREGGQRNTRNMLSFLSSTFFEDSSIEWPKAKWEEPRPLPHTLIYSELHNDITYEEWHKSINHNYQTALLLFYRSHLQTGNTQAFDDFINILNKNNLNVLAIATSSLKNPECLQVVDELSQRAQCSVIINTTSFSQLAHGNASLSSSPQLDDSRCFELDVPVIQAIMAANTREDWESNAQGLRARDIAMNIALPEYDGRIISRAISFKEIQKRSERTQIDLVRYKTHPERAHYVAELARRWSTLKSKPNSDKRIGLILANYPTKDGRIGNGVGLDTPASVINILKALAEQDYPIENIPEHGDDLIKLLLNNVTNDLDTINSKACLQSIAVEDYQKYFQQLPQQNQEAILKRWGQAENDPKFRNGRIMIAGIRLGLTFVGIQPTRGYNVDLVANYHDPDLVPPHSYLAFYFWLRHVYQADALAHIGKHGNLEWLPGKSVALSETCWPDLLLGPMPHLYPFIVNDPGEGAQAKRRTQAVILDHLMPPMARAETYGELLELENNVDEFYQALGVDPRREDYLRKKILKLITDINLQAELHLDKDAEEQILLNEVDAYLCELKEAQIRHGLHVYGQLATGETLEETLVALMRLPRGDGKNDQGILHALVDDLQLYASNEILFNPLDFDASAQWYANQPECLKNYMHNN